jgi:type I restriction enzyme S subunit
MQIPVPPLPEQKRIVAILDKAFAAIDEAKAKTEQNLKNARELFDSYLQQVFSQRGEGWGEEYLENLVTDDCTLSYGIVQPGIDFDNGLPVVRPTDLTREIITSNGLKLIDPSKAEGYRRTVLQGGELLVCVRGTTGTTAIACNTLEGANVTRGIVPVRFDPSMISLRFGFYQFISPLVQEQIQAATYGAALMQINIRDFRKVKICMPSLQVQSEIANQLDEIKPNLLKIEKIYELKLARFDELKKSLLQKAFSGELTAKQAEEAVA